MGDKLQQILLVEDNQDDVFFMQRAVEKAGLPWNLTLVQDGQEALDYFATKGKFSDRNQFPLPSLVFLDLKLPYVSGFDVLRSLKENPTLKGLPVVILTSSPEERDRKRTFELGAAAYLIKPPGEEILHKIARGEWEKIS